MQETRRNQIICLIVLVLAASLPYLPLLKGQFLFDDYQVIYTNNELYKVKTFADAFSFVLKPAKPVTNFFIAVGHLIGHGVFGHRLISLVFHSLVVCLIYFNFKLLLRRYRKENYQLLPFISALTFALLPIQSEAMAVTLFRMEIMGTFFTLFLLLMGFIYERKKNYLLLFAMFLSLGLAQLSKETFAWTAFLSFIVVHCLFPFNKKNMVFILASQLFWALILYLLLQKDIHSEFPYVDVIGFNVVPPLLMIKLSARAVLELFQKTVLGHPLTMIRISDRWGLGVQLGFLSSGFILLCYYAGFIWMAFKQGLIRVLSLLVLIGTTVYLFIPNLNIGSEHYTYFPLIGLVGLFYYGMVTFFSKVLPNPNRIIWFTVCMLSVSHIFILEKRLSEMSTRLDFNFSEILKHPETPVSWNNVAVAILESESPKRFELAKPYMEKSKEVGPNSVNVHMTEFFYYITKGEKEEAKKSLKRMEELFPNQPEKISRYHKYLGLDYGPPQG